MTAAVVHETIKDEDHAAARSLLTRIDAVFAQRVVGQHNLRVALVSTLLAGGHILLESVPGLAKTTAAQTLAAAVSGSFRRIQCTPDLMPNDIVGTQIFNYATGSFTTQLGPVHANFVLLDEINRSSAKTQSAMLEAMQEKQTSIGGEVYPLPAPFMVLATQNPIEEEGTYVLPEAQMDRFLVKEVLTYPEAGQEVEILDRITSGRQVAPISGEPITLGDLQALQRLVDRVYVDAAVKRYVVDIVATTRGQGPRPVPGLSGLVRVGASPRGSIALMRIGQALALQAGRSYVTPEDIKAMRRPVLRHRLVRTFDALADNVPPEQLVDAVFDAVPTPLTAWDTVAPVPPDAAKPAVPHETARGSGTRLGHLRARLDLPVARRATGLLDGRHRSVLQGHGQDFDDLSLYTPGDDVGDIDWKSSARAGIPVIKRFVRQSNLNLVLAVDTGRTMAATAAGGQVKGHVAAEAAALVAYVARDRGDRVALVAADSGRLTQQPPRGGTAHLEMLLRQVDRSFTTEAPASDVGRLLTRVAGGFARRALVVLLTDEAHPAPEHADALKAVCTRHEVVVLSVADADPLAPAAGTALRDVATRDVGDGWAVPAWLQGRPDLQQAAAAVRAERAATRAAMLRRMQVHDAVVGHTDDIVPALVDVLRRSRRARR